MKALHLVFAAAIVTCACTACSKPADTSSSGDTAAAAAAASAAPAVSDSAAAAAEVIRLSEKYYEAVKANHEQSIDSLLAPEFMNVHPNGSISSENDLLAAHRAGTRTLTRLDAEQVEARVFGGDVAVVSAVVHAEGMMLPGQPAPADNLATRVWVRRADGHWNLVLAHATPINTAAPVPPAAAPAAPAPAPAPAGAPQTAAASADSAASAREVATLVQRWSDALETNNVGALDSMLANDALVVNANGRRLPAADHLAYHASGRRTFSRHEVKDLNVRIYGGDAAVVNYRGDTLGKEDDRVFTSAEMSMVLRRSAAGPWEVVLLQMTLPPKK